MEPHTSHHSLQSSHAASVGGLPSKPQAQVGTGVGGAGVGGGVGGAGVGGPSRSLKASRLGEPFPALEMALGVARPVIASFKSSVVRDGDSEAKRAAMPATWGAAMEVPDKILVAVSLVCQAARTLVPGAKIWVQVPK